MDRKHKEHRDRAKKFSVHVSTLHGSTLAVGVNSVDTILQLKQKITDELQKEAERKDKELKKKEKDAAKEAQRREAAAKKARHGGSAAAASAAAAAAAAALVEEQKKAAEEAEAAAQAAVADSDTHVEDSDYVAPMRVSFEGVELKDTLTLADYPDIAKDSLICIVKPDPTKGLAVFKFADAVYEGEWQMFAEGKRRHGHGEFRTNGETYVGMFQRGAMTGRGTYVFASGASYKGMFRGGDFSGQGVYTWPSGARYTGAWQANKMHGEGCFVTTSGDRYQGMFHNDRFLNKDGAWIAPDEHRNTPIA